MDYTDEQLGMIEQLTYLDKNVAEKAGIEGFDGIGSQHENKTIEQILEPFDDEALSKLENYYDPKKGNTIDFTDGKEWAANIRYLKNSPMKDLVLTDSFSSYDRAAGENKTMGLAFAEEGNTSDGIVAFRGTGHVDEWMDNVEGFNRTDTKYQREALNFIENLNYQNITVTGHSKGGNKAMYVAILSDKVVRCVAWDGQGFSKEFLDKYWFEILENSHKITEYSVSTDFVHVLMFPIPGSNQVYVIGHGINGVGEHHTMNSFFEVKDGQIVVDKNGNPVMTVTSEHKSATMLYNFTAYLLTVASDEDKQIIVNYVTTIMDLGMSGQYSPEQKISFMLSNEDALVTTLAYLIAYMDTYDLKAKDINDLFEMLTGERFPKALETIIDYTFGQLTDNKDDPFINFLLSQLSNNKLFKFLGIDFERFWNKLESKTLTIPRRKAPSTSKIRDFSSKVYNALSETMRNINRLADYDVDNWTTFSGEEWYPQYSVSTAVTGINEYFVTLKETNQKCDELIDNVFEKVESIDNNYAGKILAHSNKIKEVKTTIKSISDKIVTK